MIKREILPHLKKMLKQFPAIALLGPRQVGKTTLAKELGKWRGGKVIYLDLEKQSDRRRLADPELFFESHRDKLIILDEIQTMPELFTALRPEIDEKRKAGRFLLTGSASPELVRYVSESLAGRIAYIELTPLTLTECRNKKISLKRHWFRGGFPGALLAKSDNAFESWADAYIRSYTQRDLSALFGFNLSPELSRNLLSMIALTQGSLFQAELFARGLGVTGPTVSRYVDFLQGAFLVRRLPAWYINAKKRLVKSPKLYLRDSGLLHSMEQIEHPEELSGHPIVGGSWEGYCIEEICRKLPGGITPYFYRTHHGAELDLVLVRGVKPFAAIEIKHSLAPVLSAGVYEAAEDLGIPKIHVIIPSGSSYQLSEKATVISLEEFVTEKIHSVIKTRP
jgi:predicted AAA+ superfamily ATPase